MASTEMRRADMVREIDMFVLPVIDESLVIVIAHEHDRHVSCARPLASRGVEHHRPFFVGRFTEYHLCSRVHRPDELP